MALADGDALESSDDVARPDGLREVVPEREPVGVSVADTDGHRETDALGLALTALLGDAVASIEDVSDGVRVADASALAEPDVEGDRDPEPVAHRDAVALAAPEPEPESDVLGESEPLLLREPDVVAHSVTEGDEDALCEGAGL